MPALLTLQTKIGVKADGDFGPATLKAAAKYFKLSNARAAHFFAQTYHETGGFKIFEENLNYSSEGLQRVFGKYFQTKKVADAVAHNPQTIANIVYAGRMGNEDYGDGYKYRGRGAVQLTGKANYEKFGYLANPESVSDEFAFESALKFFETLWPICDLGVTEEAITKLTKKINGGTIGLEDRIKLTNKFAGML
jgi:putative chitinase